MNNMKISSKKFFSKKIGSRFLHSTFLLLLPNIVLAQKDYGLGATAEKAGLIKKAGQAVPGPATIFGTILGYALTFVGVIFFGLMVYGGFLWMTARGKEEQVKKAIELIQNAAIGLVVIFLSYVVTNFILERVLVPATGIGQ